VAELCPFEGQDRDLESGDEHQHSPPLVGPADADVVQAALVPDSDASRTIDLVAADSIAGAIDHWPARIGAFARCVCVGRCPAPDRPMRTDLVVVGDERVQLHLELSLGLGRGLLGEMFLERLVEALDLAAGLRVIGPRMLGPDPEA
jgi:hypothetical protein